MINESNATLIIIKAIIIYQLIMNICNSFLFVFILLISLNLISDK